MLSRFNLFYGLVIILNSCGGENQNLSTLNIINGVDLQPGNPGLSSTVYLNIGCTGTLVSSNMLITAAHCLFNLSSREANLSVHFGEKGKEPDHTRSVTEYKYHENFGPVFRQPPAFINDIAWVKFSGGLPNNYTPSPILSLQGLQNLSDGTPLTLVGYGRVDEQNESLNRTHLKTGPAKFRRFIDTNDPVYSAYAGMFVTQINPGTGVCWGDSGGPAYTKIRNKWVLVGASNGRDGVIAGVTGCSQGAARFAAIGFYQNWIESTSHTQLMTE